MSPWWIAGIWLGVALLLQLADTFWNARNGDPHSFPDESTVTLTMLWPVLLIAVVASFILWIPLNIAQQAGRRAAARKDNRQ